MELIPIPKNEEIENIVLGTIIYNEGTITKVLGRLQPQYFYLPLNRELYKYMLELFNNSRTINQATVTISTNFDVEFVEKLSEAKRHPRELDSYIDILENLYAKRALVRLGSDVTSLGMGDEIVPTDSLINEVSSMVFNYLDIGRKSRTRQMDDILEETMDNLYRILESDELPGLRTGFNDVDYLTGGLQKGDEIIIAGRPSSGKTALMLKMALNVAKSGKYSVIFSYEMPDTSLVQRLLSIESGVNLSLFRSGMMKPHERVLVEEAHGKLKDLPLLINDGVTGNVSYIAAECKALSLQGKLDLLCVDYIQLMPTGSGNRNVELGVITKTLKNLAKELRIPVIALSQLNRAVEAREEHRPILSDLRESGNIEQDADIVSFIYRHELYYPGVREGEAELIIAKHRNGPLNNIKLEFIEETANFNECPQPM